MSEFFGSVWWLIVSLGVLVTFHEFGHFWVARRCGVKVLRFSVGFGKPLWKRVGRDGTEYVVAALPLGGYVKMLDEREVEVPAGLRDQAFNHKPVGQRIAIVAAGPLANLLLCVGLLWAMFLVGKPDSLPEVGRAEGIAAEAGFQPGDRILAVGEREIRTLTEAGIALATAAIDREPTEVRVRTAEGYERLRLLPLDRPGLVLDEERPFASLGLVPAWPPVIADIAPGSAAEGRLRPGDRVLSLDGQPIQTSWRPCCRNAPARTAPCSCWSSARAAGRRSRSVPAGSRPSVARSGSWACWRRRPRPMPCCGTVRWRRCRSPSRKPGA
jgi:regulator of sigma E protease